MNPAEPVSGSRVNRFPNRPWFRARRAALAVVALAAAACDPSPLPTEPLAPDQPPPADPLPTPQAQSQLLSDRSRVMDPRRFELVSSADELAAGRYRYRTGGQVPEEIERDDFLVGQTDAPFVRRVLSSRVDRDEMVIETGHAYWGEVIKSGTYGIRMPLDPRAGPAVTYAGEAVSPVTVGLDGMELPTLDAPIPRTDLCQLVADLLATLVGDNAPEFCGAERDVEIAVGVEITLAGRVDSLVILDGHATLTGDMDLEATVDGGGLVGGSAPVFAPCNRGAFLGCLATPTGANLAEWLRRYAPAIPEASLPSIRICVPGSPVRVKAGYWDRSGFIPRWVLPVFEKCRITNAGTLPEIVMPSVTSVETETRPHLVGFMTLRVKGDGALGIKIPIPSLGGTVGYSLGSNFKAKAAAGIFIKVDFTMRNAGATVRLDFDGNGVVTQTWSEDAGWGGDFDPGDDSKVNGQVIEVEAPDTLIARLSGLAEAQAELCLAVVDCDVPAKKTPQAGSPASLLDAGIHVGAKVAVSTFVEATRSRDQVNPADALIDNWHVDIDGAYDLQLEAGLKIQLGPINLTPNKATFKKTFECCRLSLADLWGTGELQVVTSTTGLNPDPDGYVVTVERSDTLPMVIDSGAVRLGRARDYGSPLEVDIPVSDSVLFSPRFKACGAAYSDLAVFLAPVVVGPALPVPPPFLVAALEAAGVRVPNYAVTSTCDLLIARHTVTLGGVSDNCTVADGPSRTVWLRQKDLVRLVSGTVRVPFDVVCDAAGPLGDLQITTSAYTFGEYAHDYKIAIDGVSHGAIGPNATRTITALRAGTRTVAFTAGPGNCVGTDPVDVVIPAGGVGTVTVNPVCFAFDETPPPGQVTVVATTTGDGQDGDGYQVKLDGMSRAGVTGNGSAAVQDVPPLVPSVLHVTNLAGNCRPTTPTPWIVTLDADATPVNAPFGATCTSAAVDSVRGTIETAGWPTPSVSLRPESGDVLGLTGPARPELVQLAGQVVRVWGVKAGTSLDVYGYELTASPADPRTVGIVVLRGDGLWLFGETAVQLVDAPPDLAALTGALVWVSGETAGAGLRPRAFGVIRGAQP